MLYLKIEMHTPQGAEWTVRQPKMSVWHVLIQQLFKISTDGTEEQAVILLHGQLYCVIYNNVYVNHANKLWIENEFIFWPNSESGCMKQKEQEWRNTLCESISGSKPTRRPLSFPFLSHTHSVPVTSTQIPPHVCVGVCSPIHPHSSASHCFHPRTSSSPASQWFVRPKVPHDLGSELEEGSTPCLVAWMYYLFDFLNKMLRLSKVRDFLV